MRGRRPCIINSGSQSRIKAGLLKIKMIGFSSESRLIECLTDQEEGNTGELIVAYPLLPKLSLDSYHNIIFELLFYGC